MGKVGSICHFPRPLPASIWVHCAQVLGFTSIWGARMTVTLFVLFLFFQHLGSLRLPNTAKQEKTQNDKSTLFLPPSPPTMSLFVEHKRENSSQATYPNKSIFYGHFSLEGHMSSCILIQQGKNIQAPLLSKTL